MTEDENEDDLIFKEVETICDELDNNPHLSPETKFILTKMIWNEYDPTSPMESPCDECPGAKDDYCDRVCWCEVLSVLQMLFRRK